MSYWLVSAKYPTMSYGLFSFPDWPHVCQIVASRITAQPVVKLTAHHVRVNFTYAEFWQCVGKEVEKCELNISPAILTGVINNVRPPNVNEGSPSAIQRKVAPSMGTAVELG